MAVFAKFCLINFHFPHGVIVNGIAPLWDGVLWLQFAAILPSFLRWLSCWHWLSSVLGLVGGPLAYYAGERAGAVEMALMGTLLSGPVSQTSSRAFGRLRRSRWHPVDGSQTLIG